MPGESKPFDGHRYLRLCRCVISGIEQHAASAVRAWISGQEFCAKVIEGLHDTGAGARSANTSLDMRPPRSAGLNSGASMGLLASTTMRPFQS